MAGLVRPGQDSLKEARALLEPLLSQHLLIILIGAQINYSLGTPDCHRIRLREK